MKKGCTSLSWNSMPAEMSPPWIFEGINAHPPMLKLRPSCFTAGTAFWDVELFEDHDNQFSLCDVCNKHCLCFRIFAVRLGRRQLLLDGVFFVQHQGVQLISQWLGLVGQNNITPCASWGWCVLYCTASCEMTGWCCLWLAWWGTRPHRLSLTNIWESSVTRCRRRTGLWNEMKLSRLDI